MLQRPIDAQGRVQSCPGEAVGRSCEEPAELMALGSAVVDTE